MSTLPCPKCEKPRGIFGPCPHCHEDKMSKHWFRLLEEEREKVKGLEQKLAEAMRVIEQYKLATKEKSSFKI